jgi:hypothetical protein
MPKEKSPKSKKKIKQNLSQKERFIEYAKDRDSDESGELFEKTMKKVAMPKKTT